MGKIFCVEFQRYPFKFHTKYLTHTLKYVSFAEEGRFKSFQIYDLVSVFETPPLGDPMLRQIYDIISSCCFLISDPHSQAEGLNQKAIDIVNKVKDKLTGQCIIKISWPRSKLVPVQGLKFQSS